MGGVDGLCPQPHSFAHIEEWLPSEGADSGRQDQFIHKTE